jgi:hypothetical protein
VEPIGVMRGSVARCRARFHEASVQVIVGIRWSAD